MLRDRESFAGGLECRERKRERPDGSRVVVTIRINDVSSRTVGRVGIARGRAQEESASILARRLNVDAVTGPGSIHCLKQDCPPSVGQIDE
jgi:hypothetical protein